MKNNEMIEYKEGFFAKIRKFFRGIFGKEEQQSSYIQEETKESVIEATEDKKDSFVNDIKIDSKVVDSVVEKKNFLEEIEGNEEALKMLSLDRLLKLEKYYDNVIEENDKIIKKLKNSVNQ